MARETSSTSDPFTSMSVAQLAAYAYSVNIFLERPSQRKIPVIGKHPRGILIGVMDLEPSKNAVKVLVNGQFAYWPTDDVRYAGSKPREYINHA